MAGGSVAHPQWPTALVKPTGHPHSVLSAPASDGHQPTDALRIEPSDDPWLVADVGGTHARIGVSQPTLGLQQPMRFANDHDPLPLLDQLRARYGDAVSIEYRQRDPGMIVIDFLVRE